MNKNHDCISKVRESLMKGDPRIKWVRFEQANILRLDEKMKPVGNIKTGQKIEYGYTLTKKDGKEVEKTAKSYVTHLFCPFCGEKYK